jgi:hypothetical protein
VFFLSLVAKSTDLLKLKGTSFDLKKTNRIDETCGTRFLNREVL